MAPTVVNVGAVASGTTSITPAFPAGIAAGHVLVTIAECEGVTAPGAFTLPAGWAHVTGSPVQEGTNTRLWVIYRVYDGVFTAPALGDAGDHGVGRMIAISGCPTTGVPWDVTAAAVEAVSDTSVAWPSATTTVPDTLVLHAISTGTDVASTAMLGAVTNAALASITEQIDNWVTSGNGGGIAAVTGVKATAGAIGQSTATLTTANTKAMLTVAFKLGGSSGGVASPQFLLRSPRPVEQPQVAGPHAQPGPQTTLL